MCLFDVAMDVSRVLFATCLVCCDVVWFSLVLFVILLFCGCYMIVGVVVFVVLWFWWLFWLFWLL